MPIEVFLSLLFRDGHKGILYFFPMEEVLGYFYFNKSSNTIQFNSFILYSRLAQYYQVKYPVTRMVHFRMMKIPYYRVNDTHVYITIIFVSLVKVELKL